MNKIRLADQPITDDADDALRLGPYADALAQYAQTCDTPASVAIQGPAGSGKTSLLNLVELRLKAAGVKTARLNAWPFASLADSDSVIVSLAVHLIEAIGSPGDQATKEAFDGQHDPIDPGAILEMLKAVLAKIVNAASWERLVIFVDELDRLADVQAVSLLEALTSLLNQEGCVLMPVGERAALARGFQRKYALADGEGDAYVDRMVQASFRMPVSEYPMEEFIRSLLAAAGIDIDDTELPILIELAGTSIGFNPRAVKRVIGALKLLRLIAAARNIREQGEVRAGEAELTRVLFAILCLQNAYGPTFRLLSRAELTDSLFEKLKSYETLAETDEFAELRAELRARDEEQTLRRLALFMQAFYRAIQLALDDDDERLSQGEADNLAAILKFSALVAAQPDTGEAELPDRDQQMAHAFAAQLNEKYASLLEPFHGPGTGAFRAAGRRGSAQGAASVAYWNFVFPRTGNQLGLTLEFLPDQLAVWATAERRADRVFIKKLLEDTFPDAAFPQEAWSYLLHEKDFDPGANWAKRAEVFQAEATAFLDKFLPEIVKKAQE